MSNLWLKESTIFSLQGQSVTLRGYTFGQTRNILFISSFENFVSGKLKLNKHNGDHCIYIVLNYSHSLQWTIQMQWAQVKTMWNHYRSLGMTVRAHNRRDCNEWSFCTAIKYIFWHFKLISAIRMTNRKTVGTKITRHGYRSLGMTVKTDSDVSVCT